MELETCEPIDGFYQKGHPECLKCHYLAQAMCKLMAQMAGGSIEDIEGLLVEESNE